MIHGNLSKMRFPISMFKNKWMIENQRFVRIIMIVWHLTRQRWSLYIIKPRVSGFIEIDIFHLSTGRYICSWRQIGQFHNSYGLFIFTIFVFVLWFFTIIISNWNSSRCNASFWFGRASSEWIWDDAFTSSTTVLQFSQPYFYYVWIL